jgi:hypothetical protein
MKKDGKKLWSIFLLLTLSIAASSFTLGTVSAKNMNIPENARINYWTGGIGTVETPVIWPTGGLHQSMLRFDGFEVEDGSLGTTDALIIAIPTSLGWVAIACFATNPDAAAFMKTVRSGMPAAAGPLNTKTVTADTLVVERHGNRISVELKTPQTIYWTKAGGTGYIQIQIPAFTMELNKIDGSVHKDHIDYFTGYTGASEYTVYVDEMGFNAAGTFTCPTWNYLDQTMSTCFITMHGINIYLPP